jgi:hypothetical protein
MLYRDPPPAIPDPESDESDHSIHSEQVNLVSDSCSSYFTLPEALECAYSFSIAYHDNSPKSYSEAMRQPDAHFCQGDAKTRPR